MTDTTTTLPPPPETERKTMDDNTVFATASFPLPKDHWLTTPRGEWDSARDDFAELPHPILTHALRDAVVAAVRYAVRGATNCGQEKDFDPDALVQNAVYALCGPFCGAALAQSAQPALDPEAIIRACIPGGSICDPQQVADAIRRYLDAWPQFARAPAQPSLLYEAAQWLHAAYDRPPQTPEARAMLARVDATLAQSARGAR